MTDEHVLDRLLIEHRDDLLRFFTRHAGIKLLRFESADDLVQGMIARCLTADFEYRSDKEFFSWMYTLARRYIADRASYWTALKRYSSGVLRLGPADTGGFDTRRAFEPAGSGTSPSMYALRREQLVLMSKAMSTLIQRDQDLLRWSSQGDSIAEIAARLEISLEAAQRARLRALERLEKAFRFLSQ